MANAGTGASLRGGVHGRGRDQCGYPEKTVLGAAWVQAEVVDRPTVSAQDTHLPGGLAQLGGRCGWELPYKARARTAEPRCPWHCAYAPRGAGRPQTGRLCTRPWGLWPPSVLSSRTGLRATCGVTLAGPAFTPRGSSLLLSLRPPRWPGGLREQVSQRRPGGLRHVSSRERWFWNSSSGLQGGASLPAPTPTGLCWDVGKGTSKGFSAPGSRMFFILESHFPTSLAWFSPVPGS